MELLFFVISFLASIIGGICGIGGGIIIKPALDLSGLASIATISFLSSCTVLSMSAYNVCKSLSEKSGAIDTKSGTPLAIGAALGGVAGNKLFSYLQHTLGNDAVTGTAQALCLLVLTAGTLVYTLKKASVKTRHTGSPAACVAIGLVLGALSSFLGIGGGPFNLVVLHYFFSMDTKKSVSNSLYIILFSQITNLVVSLVSGTVPPFTPLSLGLMILGGVVGGIVGKAVSRRMDNKAVDKLFIVLMCVIICICIYNAAKYL